MRTAVPSNLPWSLPLPFFEPLIVLPENFFFYNIRMNADKLAIGFLAANAAISFRLELEVCPLLLLARHRV